MQKRYLLAPGPTAIPPEVLLKMAEPILHHRNPLFEEVVAEVRENLKWLFGTKNEVLFFASSGTGAMEGAVTNMLSPGDKAICVRSGKFGERWANICKAYGVQSEILQDDWGIDVLVSGSQKALMLPPGLAFAGISDKAWGFNKTSTIPKFYFNWAKELANLEKNQTNFTPAISLIMGLRESLRMMKEEGRENVFRRIDILARATREGAMALGLKVFAKSPSPAVTAIVAPEGIDGQAIYKTLWKKYGVTGAGGQDQLKGKIFRIATLGYADKYDVITAMSALEFTLRDLGYKFQMGTGVAKALEVLTEL